MGITTIIFKTAFSHAGYVSLDLRGTLKVTGEWLGDKDQCRRQAGVWHVEPSCSKPSLATDVSGFVGMGVEPWTHVPSLTLRDRYIQGYDVDRSRCLHPYGPFIRWVWIRIGNWVPSMVRRKPGISVSSSRLELAGRFKFLVADFFLSFTESAAADRIVALPVYTSITHAWQSSLPPPTCPNQSLINIYRRPTKFPPRHARKAHLDDLLQRVPDRGPINRRQVDVDVCFRETCRAAQDTIDILNTLNRPSVD
ncbi:hypothetical protein Hypma_002915 [Hypsizygus marmoreus]|uniref:Uncharacterized protein n=1 Tax=Hypsizygus marmoreus TaxID=39966 RepID=A0A369JCE4_HYPMA|nr:hypothetical protein Hypma_002915 [Hypsizygus marmoreus]